MESWRRKSDLFNIFPHFQVAILASAGLSQGAPQSDPSLARILQEQRYHDHNDSDIMTIMMINDDDEIVNECCDENDIDKDINTANNAVI